MAGSPTKQKPVPTLSVVQESYTNLQPLMLDTLESVYGRLRKILEDEGFTPTIKHRVKKFENYYDKLVKLLKQAPPSDVLITDLLGLRVVCPFLEDLENVERLISNHFDVIERADRPINNKPYGNKTKKHRDD